MSKKKILLLSDDLRMSSGIGTMSKEFVLGTMKHYDWVQMGGAIKHPENGKVVNMDDSVRKETGVEDAKLTIYPVNGYGNPELLRDVISQQKPDAIMHYTDPRFWGWLYEMEHEIRQEIPIFYYNIWDDWPAPHYNEFFYESSDLIMNISKQTVAIVKEVAKKKPRTDWDNTYIPHGVNKQFYPISVFDDEYKQVESMKKQLTDDDDDIEFVMFYNNRNIRRKNPGDLILAFKLFCDTLTKEEANKCCLLMHTQPVDENGTHLPEVVKAICPDYKVYFSNKKVEVNQLNWMYNIADVTINIASNEGFGLGTCESLMAGTPITVNITGGLQDQCGFKLKKYSPEGSGFTEEFLTAKDYSEIKSLHDDRKWANNPDLTWGEWVKPVWPSNRALVGSIPTPYIFDDRCRFDDVADIMKEWYNMSPEDRGVCGTKGREFVLSEDSMMSSEHMCQNFIDHMDTAFDKWKPRKRYSIFKA